MNSVTNIKCLRTNKTMKTMRKSVLLLLLWVVCLCTHAQDLSVKTFRLLSNDMTASSIEGKRIDQNNEVAALIKVVTAETGFVFEGGSLGIVDTKQKVGEIWVWVPRGLRKMTILHQDLGRLRDYQFPIEIEPERTYEMVLVSGTTETTIKPSLRQQYLAFQITPPNATLEVNDQAWEVGSDGTAMKFVNFGTYTWRVQAPDYHPQAGKIVVNDPNNTQKVPVNLLPNFGWIEVTGEGLLQGASVYIDNMFVGKAPCKSEAISSGQHLVRVSKERYEPYSEVVTVKDTETTKISPTLNAGFAEVTLQVDADAEIWVNNEKKGIRSWTGILGNGTYWIECKQENHDPSITTQEINASMNGRTIMLNPPHPIYGSLNVESTPAFASIFIDGEPMGETPKFVSELLVGQHELRLSKDGYVTRTETVVIVKGERTQVQAKLGKAGDGHDSNVVPKVIQQEEVPAYAEQPSSPANPKNNAEPVQATKQEKPIVEKPEKPRIENNKNWNSVFFGTINASISSMPKVSFGFTVGQVKHFGWFASVMSNFNFNGMSPIGQCDVNGYTEDGSFPLYSGESAINRFSLIVGGVMRFSEMFGARLGVGYGMRNLNWQTIDGQYYRNSAYSINGLDVSAGIQMHFGSFVVFLEGVSTNFKTMEGRIGLGMGF